MELVSILDNLILIIIVSQSGAIFQKKIQTEETVSQESLYKISRYLNQRLKGYEISDLQQKGLSFLVDTGDLFDQELMNIAVQVVQAFVYNPPDQQVYIDGEGNFYRQLLEQFSDSDNAKYIMNSLLDKQYLRNIINQLRNASKVTFRIGVQLNNKHIPGISILAKGYSVGGQNMGALGVIGCSRIPYDKLIPTIDYSSILLSNVLDENSDEINNNKGEIEIKQLT